MLRLRLDRSVRMNDSKTEIPNAATNAAGNTEGDQIKEVLPVKKLETMGDQIKEVLPVKKLETMEEENNENKESLPDAQNRNSANSNMKTTELCIILGAITSVFVSFALAS